MKNIILLISLSIFSLSLNADLSIFDMSSLLLNTMAKKDEEAHNTFVAVALSLHYMQPSPFSVTEEEKNTIKNILSDTIKKEVGNQQCLQKVNRLVEAVKQKKLSDVKTTVESGVNINGWSSLPTIDAQGNRHEDKVRHTPLTAAIRHAPKNTDIIIYLLKNGAHPDIKNMFGYTPLMYAVQNKRLDLVTLLMDPPYCANTTLTNGDGLTALQLANKAPSDQLSAIINKLSQPSACKASA